ncbi:LOW QUALITY PROTEIN: uncharacterized protein Dere_GG26302 [Drosophila erecta]|uniref:Uncharacterized protein n=1 Tax=Drosophila erecta TaxID=7220 RepID=A0A0Q5U3X6_DROER|nr:LOW QUALITY PROTEIN: uncharacterized protein Dere_GG26302 [Drosophila erecta]
MPSICCSSRLRGIICTRPKQIQLTNDADTCRIQDDDAMSMPQSLTIKTPAKTTKNPILHMKSPLRPELGLTHYKEHQISGCILANRKAIHS